MVLFSLMKLYLYYNIINAITFTFAMNLAFDAEIALKIIQKYFVILSSEGRDDLIR